MPEHVLLPGDEPDWGRHDQKGRKRPWGHSSALIGVSTAALRRWKVRKSRFLALHFYAVVSAIPPPNSVVIENKPTNGGPSHTARTANAVAHNLSSLQQSSTQKPQDGATIGPVSEPPDTHGHGRGVRQVRDPCGDPCGRAGEALARRNVLSRLPARRFLRQRRLRHNCIAEGRDAAVVETQNLTTPMAAEKNPKC